MTTLGIILSWIICIMVALLSLLVLGMGGYIQFVLILGMALVFFPPWFELLKSHGWNITWWMRAMAVVFLYGGVMLSFILNPARSIYKSPDDRERLMKIYEGKL